MLRYFKCNFRLKENGLINFYSIDIVVQEEHIGMDGWMGYCDLLLLRKSMAFHHVTLDKKIKDRNSVPKY